MYRVLFVLGGGLLLAGCESSSSWMNFDALKPTPITENIQFESDPPGAEAALSTGQKCTTPCAVAVPASAPFTVTFALRGYQPDTEQVELVSMGDGTSRLRPNPVLAEMTAAPPSAAKPAAKKPAPKKKTTAKPAPKPAAAAPAPAAASTTASAPAVPAWPAAKQQ